MFDTLKLPELLGSEGQLRTLWANPMTRRELLKKLEGAGCHADDLRKLQELIDAQDSDPFFNSSTKRSHIFISSLVFCLRHFSC